MSYPIQPQQRTTCIKPVSARVLSTDSIPEGFSNIVSRIIPVLGYKAAMLCVLTEQRESLVLKHACGISEISNAT